MPDEIVEELRGKKLHPPAKPRDAKDNALMLGEFPVVMDLIKEMPEAAAAKEQVTKPSFSHLTKHSHITHCTTHYTLHITQHKYRRSGVGDRVFLLSAQLTLSWCK